VQGTLQGAQIGRPEDHAILGGDIDEIEIDACPGYLAGQVGQHAGLVLHVDHDDLALAAYGQMGDGQGMSRGFGVWHQDVDFGALA
jgi:hypothetical protein